MPTIKRHVLRIAAPAIPLLAHRVARLNGPSYPDWFVRWQESQPSEDAAILAALPATPPPFLVVVADGAAGVRTRASLAAQLGPAGDAALRAQVSPERLRRLAKAGGYLLRLEAGETLARHALAVLAIAAAEYGRPAVLVADEDVLDDRGRHRDPWFKTAFDPYRLLQQDAFGCAVAYSADLLLRHGLADLQGHALALAATRAAIGDAGETAIRHVPAVLMHRAASGPRAPWRTATDPSAVAAALAAEGGAVLRDGGVHRPLRIAWSLPATVPRVSVIVPTRDRPELLRACVEGVLRRTDYPSLELLIVDNDSREPATQALLQSWSADARVRVLRHPGPFNYAAMNNRAAEAARGEVLLLLNNDTEVRHPDWLREMVSLAVRPTTGAVGARLLFPSGRVQHAGIVLGMGGVAGHDMLFARGTDPGPQDDLRLVRRVSAVTGACLAVRRAAYLEVGGMDQTRFRVTGNDLDLCLRLLHAGYHNLVTPCAELLHRESSTRGSDISPEQLPRWEQERAAFRASWSDLLSGGDPHYNPHLSLDAPFRQLAERPRMILPWRRP